MLKITTTKIQYIKFERISNQILPLKDKYCSDSVVCQVCGSCLVHGSHLGPGSLSLISSLALLAWVIPSLCSFPVWHPDTISGLLWWSSWHRTYCYNTKLKIHSILLVSFTDWLRDFEYIMIWVFDILSFWSYDWSYVWVYVWFKM